MQRSTANNAAAALTNLEAAEEAIDVLSRMLKDTSTTKISFFSQSVGGIEISFSNEDAKEVVLKATIAEIKRTEQKFTEYLKTL